MGGARVSSGPLACEVVAMYAVDLARATFTATLERGLAAEDDTALILEGVIAVQAGASG